MSVKILHGDCLVILPTIPADSIDAIVTDPPYGLEFMGKEWDKFAGAPRKVAGTGGQQAPFAHHAVKLDGQRGKSFQQFMHEVAIECLRVLKPGGHLVAFGGSRTYHRLACAVEDAGFEIRDQIQWLYGSGFPKSRNIGEGRGTALKPAHEPIVLARKLIVGTVAANAEKYGTGALNIDACRVEGEPQPFGNGTARSGGIMGASQPRGAWEPPTNGREGEPSAERRYTDNGGTNFAMKPGQRRKGGRRPSTQEGYQRPGATMFQDKTDWELSPKGRWPANVIHDGSEEVLEGFPRADSARASGNPNNPRHGSKDRVATSYDWNPERESHDYRDTGSAARFFYTAKADKGDRLQSKHPTVKPVDLMAYLVRLVTPPGGTVLDPFAGSGTTGMACLREGVDCILIEREAEYVADIERRVAHVSGTDSPLFAGGI